MGEEGINTIKEMESKNKYKFLAYSLLLNRIEKYALWGEEIDLESIQMLLKKLKELTELNIEHGLIPRL